MPYRPNIRLAIPADIPTAEHAAISAVIAALNDRLSARILCQTKRDAMEVAGWALHYSKVGACGIPDSSRVKDVSPAAALGAIKSARKSATSRENGAKGGRPPKPTSAPTL